MIRTMTQLRGATLITCAGLVAGVLPACSGDDSSTTTPNDSGTADTSTSSSTSSSSSSSSSQSDAGKDSGSMDSSVSDSSTTTDSSMADAPVEAAVETFVSPNLCQVLNNEWGYSAEAGLYPGDTWAQYFNQDGNNPQTTALAFTNDCRLNGMVNSLYGPDGGFKGTWTNVAWLEKMNEFTQAFMGCPDVTDYPDAGPLSLDLLLPRNPDGSPSSHVYTRADLDLIAATFLNAVISESAWNVASQGITGGTPDFITAEQVQAIQQGLKVLEDQMQGVNPSTTVYTWSTCASAGDSGATDAAHD